MAPKVSTCKAFVANLRGDMEPEDKGRLVVVLHILASISLVNPKAKTWILQHGCKRGHTIY